MRRVIFHAPLSHNRRELSPQGTKRAREENGGRSRGRPRPTGDGLFSPRVPPLPPGGHGRICTIGAWPRRVRRHDFPHREQSRRFVRVMVEEVKPMPEHIPCSRDSAEADGLRPDAFLEDAMHRWGDTVLRLALSQLRDASDAEDVFQRRVRPPAQGPHGVQRRRALEGVAVARDHQPLPRHRALGMETPQRAACRTPCGPGRRGARPAGIRHLERHRHPPARPARRGAPALRGGLFHRRGGRPRGMPPLHRAHAPAPRPQAPEGRPRDRGSRRPPCALPTGGRIARGRRLRFFAPRQQRVCEPPTRGQSLRLRTPRNHRFPVFRKGGRP